MRRVFSLIACAWMAASANSSDTPPTTLSSTILTLVDQLGAEGYSEREKASTQLEKIGLPAVEALRSATQSENPEIRDRATSLVERIQRFSDSAKRLAAKTVKLSYKDVSLSSAFLDLKSRTGLNIAIDPSRISNPLRRITCETNELPVWEALEAFCAATELREVFAAELETPKSPGPLRGFVPPPPPPNADAVPVILVDGKVDRLPGDRSTSVRIVALPPSYSGHKVTLGTGEVNMSFDVTPVPGLAWQEVLGVKVSRVIDSEGRFGGAGTEKTPAQNFDPSGVIMFARPGVAFRFDSQGNTLLPDSIQNPRAVSVPLRIGTPTAKSLKRLEGIVFGEIQVQNQQLIVVSEPKRSMNMAIPGAGELRFTVLDLKEGTAKGELGSFRVQLEYPSPWLINSRRRGGWNPGWPEAPQNPRQAYRVEAMNAAGHPLPITQGSSLADTSDDGQVMILTMQFTYSHSSGVPAKLVVVGPKIVTVQVPFAMENVPLP